MKTIKAGRELIQLADNPKYVENEVFTVIRSYRAGLIQALLASGLDTYIELRFRQRISPQLLADLERSLTGLAHSALLPGEFPEVVNGIRKFDFYALPSEPFYRQIDERLRQGLVQTEINFRTSLKRTPRLHALARTA
ncbi:MAG: hypothetical protein ACK5DD_16795 [Cyclobacteriaceae bacterium]|jgi:hypothetical protein